MTIKTFYTPFVPIGVRTFSSRVSVIYILVSINLGAEGTERSILGLSAHLVAYVNMFFWALQSMRSKAQIISLDPPDTPELSHKEFGLRCAWTLINAAVSTPSRATQASKTAPRAGPSVSGVLVTATTQLPLDRTLWTLAFAS
jgi:hypothetical protein